VFNEDVDVLVCDGGTGSALLQTSDAVLAFLRRADAEAARRTGGEGAWTDILAQAEPPAGFPLLGIEGTCILAHHARSEQTIANAVHLAATAMTQQVNHGIVQETEHGPLD
jgi:glycerol-3-phosphate acyltransferase PlsX